MPTLIKPPLHSLQQGHWFKLICGASFQHLPAVRTLCLVYTLAGADCIDVAADPAVIHAAQAGIKAAQAIQPCSVWLMVSLNDGEDPHFRKATFDPAHCPPDCPKPCLSICPARAIEFDEYFAGIHADRCYGCGRCLPVCPIQHIVTQSQPAALETITSLIEAGQVDALELHTQVGHEAEFEQLWEQITPYLSTLNILSVSCPDAPGSIPYLEQLQHRMLPIPCPIIWQTDGRPMSGDIGDGTTRATLHYGERVLQSSLTGFVQLAGGTNAHTVQKLLQRSQTRSPRMGGNAPTAPISGVAFGSYARSLLLSLQEKLEAKPNSSYCLEDYPDLLGEGIRLAVGLVEPLKQS